MGAYFGEPWPSGVCDGGHREATPVGEDCWWCVTGIQPDDQGYWVGVGRMDADGELKPFREPGHRECFLRASVGGLAHLEHRCRCYGGTVADQPETPQERRQEAIEVWDRVMSGRFWPPLGCPGRVNRSVSG